MQPTTLAKPLALLSALTSLMLAPVPAKSASSMIGTTSVCATGTCCRQGGSFCNAGGADHPDYYYLASGSCPSPS